MQLIRKKVLKFINEQRLLAPGDKVIVAFSGGADSMALLDILINLPVYPIKVVMAHLNHCLRGDESQGDELFVRSIAQKYALPLEILRVDVASAADYQGLSLEEAGRNARHSFFRDIAEKHYAAAVVLGHHCDDQAETVLMRLVRGSGGSGLTGMRPGVPGNIFKRPLLCLTRAEIEGYLRKGALQWREDSSNSDTRFLRNSIRHELLPLLKSYNPGITDCLNRTAQALVADEELLEAVVERAYKHTVSGTQEEIRMDLETLKSEPQALRKRLYRKALLAIKGNLRRISAKHLADIDRLAVGVKGSGKISLPAGVIVRREYAALILSSTHKEPDREDMEVLIGSCGFFQLGSNQTFVVESVDDPPDDWPNSDSNTLFIDLQQLPFPWTVRFFTEGDRIVPFGMSGRKKIKDLFIDKKIPQKFRKRIPLLLSAGEIFWIAGVLAAEKVRITESAKELLRLRVICEATSDRH